MYFIIRAGKYLRKKIGKTIFMAIIFFVIANFALAGLLIQEASNIAKEETRLAIGSDINYALSIDGIFDDIEKGVLDRDAMNAMRDSTFTSVEDFTANGGPTLVNILKAADSEYVSSYQISSTYTGNNSDYQQVQLESTGSSNGEFQLNLYENNIPEDFVEGTSTLVDGEFISEQQLASGQAVLMIEERFSSLNNLKVGDTLTLTYPDVNGDSSRIDHTIVGIYSSSEEASQNVAQSGNMTSYIANQFYAPLYMLTTIGYTSDEVDNLLVSDNIIRIEDPDNIDLYKAEIEGVLNLKYGFLDSNDSLYESLVGPINIVGTISNIAVAVILVTGGLIIGLITALTVNERKGEVGVLLAVGERKSKIVMQFVLEVLVIAIITFGLSIVSGDYMGQVISESSIMTEFVEEDDTASPFTGNIQRQGQGQGQGQVAGRGNQTAIDVEQPELVVSLSFDIILLLFGIGMSLAIISTIIPALYVMRFNPKQILSSRAS